MGIIEPEFQVVCGSCGREHWTNGAASPTQRALCPSCRDVNAPEPSAVAGLTAAHGAASGRAITALGDLSVELAGLSTPLRLPTGWQRFWGTNSIESQIEKKRLHTENAKAIVQSRVELINSLTDMARASAALQETDLESKVRGARLRVELLELVDRERKLQERLDHGASRRNGSRSPKTDDISAFLTDLREIHQLEGIDDHEKALRLRAVIEFHSRELADAPRAIRDFIERAEDGDYA